MATNETLGAAAQEGTEDQEIARMLDEGCPDFLPPEDVASVDAVAAKQPTPFQRLQLRNGAGALSVSGSMHGTAREGDRSFPTGQIYSE